MLRIRRSMEAENIRFALSGRIQAPDLVELERLIAEEAPRRVSALDLAEVRLVDREAVTFLARCEATGIRLENCPAYVREWIAREHNGHSEPPPTKRR
jgi:ABC-type transporter Mla MlaB component